MVAEHSLNVEEIDHYFQPVKSLKHCWSMVYEHQIKEPTAIRASIELLERRQRTKHKIGGTVHKKH
jgi:hypothetical protein